MSAIVECVPNFSEGRRPHVIEAIAEAVRSVPGVRLLDVDPDADYNRTVVTCAGRPDAVVEAAFQATARAAELIDMQDHHGGHPRIGATDVVPFVPVSGVTMPECVALARRYGERAARELGIPIYLYEEAATRPERRNLSDIRQGEYEGLTAKLRDPAWAPDFGPATFNPRSGATVAGARTFLIAYNANLATADVAVAGEIAARIRESGRLLKDEAGRPVLDEQGRKVKVPGTLRALKAIGVFLEAHGIAQVSMNLVNFHVTPPHVALEEVRAQARALGTEATGSEIVGLTPLEALLMAGRYYRERAGLPAEAPEEELLRAAEERLALSQLDPFDPKRKVIEYLLEGL